MHIGAQFHKSSWFPFFFLSILAYFDGAMYVSSASAFAQRVVVSSWLSTQREKQFPLQKLSLAVYYHYAYCLKLCVVPVFLICSELQEAHKIK